MANTQSILRAVAQRGGSAPGQALEEANEVLYTHTSLPACSSPASMGFYGVLDPESGHLRYANAGHDLPYVRRGGDAEELRARGCRLALCQG